MSTINRIERALEEMEGGAFQKLADAYLYKKGYTHINPLGSVIGSNKVRKGTPDTLITLPNGKYVFAEHTTTEQNKPVEKLKSDLAKCLDETKTGVPVSKIEEIVFCFNFLLGTEDTHQITEECQKRGVNINLFGVGIITYDLAYSYPGLAKDFLNIDVDTGQILQIGDFVSRYDKNKLTTRLRTTFQFREEEVREATQALDNFDVVLISGRSGIGKSRLALECCEKFKAIHPEFKVFGIYNAGVDIFDDLRTYFSEADSDLMESIFELTTQFSLDRRRNLLECFLKFNARFEDFERLDLEPTVFSSERGSFVPVYQARVDYLRTLLPLLNTVNLLRHRRMVEQKIKSYQSRIASEKKRDFMADY